MSHLINAFDINYDCSEIVFHKDRSTVKYLNGKVYDLNDNYIGECDFITYESVEIDTSELLLAKQAGVNKKKYHIESCHLYDEYFLIELDRQIPFPI